MCHVSEVADMPLAIKRAKALTMYSHYINGVKRALANGKFGRRPKKINVDILKRFSNSDYSTKQKIAKEANISMATMYRRLKRKEAKV